MKVRFNFKTPDAVISAAESAVTKEFLDKSTGELKGSEYDRDTLLFNVVDSAKKYIRHGESVVLELDLDTGKMVVVET